MDFLTVLTHEHLDNGIFLSSFAKALSSKKKRGIILHEDSEYTERIIQTGVMREDAQTRAIKELNQRLVALFADHGVAVVAVNGFQRSLIKIENGEPIIQKKQLELFPENAMVLISNLCEYPENNKPAPAPLPLLASSISDLFNIPEVTLFSIQDSSEIIKSDLPLSLVPGQYDRDVVNTHVPKEFRKFNGSVRLTTTSNL